MIEHILPDYYRERKIFDKLNDLFLVNNWKAELTSMAGVYCVKFRSPQALLKFKNILDI